MANRYAVQAGNWSDTSTWDGGTLPQLDDTVRPNGHIVTVDIDVDIGSGDVRTDASGSAVAGGYFEIAAGVTFQFNQTFSGLTGNIGQGAFPYVLTTNLLSGESVTIVGDLTGHINAAGSQHARFFGSGTVNIIGNVRAAGSYGLTVNNSVNVHITGNILPSAGKIALLLTTSGVVTVNGSSTISGDSQNASSTVGISIQGSPTLILNGNFSTVSNTTNRGRFCQIVSGSPAISVTGNCSAGSVGHVFDYDGSSGGTLDIIGDVVTLHNYSAVDCVNTGLLTITHTGGQIVAGNVPCFQATSVNTLLLLGQGFVQQGVVWPVNMRSMAITAGFTGMTLHSDATNAGVEFVPGAGSLPSEGDVRADTEFGPSGEYTGTLAVPDPQYVNAGVPVDNTVGTLTALRIIDLQTEFAPVVAKVEEAAANSARALMESLD